MNIIIQQLKPIIVLDSIQTKFLLGLTATPYRLDGKNILGSIDNNVAYTMNLEEGVKSKQLVPFYYHALYDNIDYSDIEWQSYKYRERDLNMKLIIDRRDNQILEEYKRSIQFTGRQRMMFCVSVKHAERMTAKLKRNGIKAESLTHETHMIDRRNIVSDFKSGKVNVLCVRYIQ
jgi:superfamily II DNA or RNA helicase